MIQQNYDIFRKFDLFCDYRFSRYFWSFVLTGLIFLLFLIVLLSQVVRLQDRIQLVRVQAQLQILTQSLVTYSLDHPKHTLFQPGPYAEYAGTVLSPIRLIAPVTLSYLTSPVNYIEKIPIDPYLSGLADRPLSPFVLHWVNTHYPWNETVVYKTAGWGAVSPGPSGVIPPQYDLVHLRRVPYENWQIKSSFYDPSNGLDSIGFLYFDSWGTQTRL